MCIYMVHRYILVKIKASSTNHAVAMVIKICGSQIENIAHSDLISAKHI